MNQLLARPENAKDISVRLDSNRQVILPMDIRSQQNEFAKIANRKLDLNSQCEFGLVSNAADWDGVQQLRMKMYHGKRDYLSYLVGHDGIDEYDTHSYLFYAKLNGKYVASVRFTEYPFETSRYFDMVELQAFLGQDYKHDYLEVGRLVADNSIKVSNLSQAILAFSVAMASSMQNKTRYLAYSHPRLKQKAFRYNQDDHTQTFYIPERRDSEYILFKGCFKQELEALKGFIN